MKLTVQNKLLAALPSKVLKEYESQMEAFELLSGQTLFEPQAVIDCVYFPLRGVISMVNEPNPGETVEFATIGPEGLAGFPLIMGVRSMPSRAMVQIPGNSLRVNASVFRKMLEGSKAANDLMQRYTMTLVTQIAQITSCNRLHEVQRRCARWLLQTHDRMHEDTFPLRQEFLAQMLGVHRPSVSVAAGMLQKAGLIEYSRGRITVVNRRGLEEASCSCYRLINQEYDRLINGRS